MGFTRRLHALFLLSLVAAAAGAPSALGANIARFTDAKGDTCCTEDIGEVVVSNDDAGRISFTITAPEVDGFDSSDRFISIFSERGEFQIGTWDGPGYILSRRWPGGRESLIAPLRASHRGDVFRFWVGRHQLGDTSRFSLTSRSFRLGH